LPFFQPSPFYHSGPTFCAFPIVVARDPPFPLADLLPPTFPNELLDFDMVGSFHSLGWVCTTAPFFPGTRMFCCFFIPPLKSVSVVSELSPPLSLSGSSQVTGPPQLVSYPQPTIGFFLGISPPFFFKALSPFPVSLSFHGFVELYLGNVSRLSTSFSYFSSQLHVATPRVGFLFFHRVDFLSPSALLLSKPMFTLPCGGVFLPLAPGTKPHPLHPSGKRPFLQVDVRIFFPSVFVPPPYLPLPGGVPYNAHLAFLMLSFLPPPGYQTTFPTRDQFLSFFFFRAPFAKNPGNVLLGASAFAVRHSLFSPFPSTTVLSTHSLSPLRPGRCLTYPFLQRFLLPLWGLWFWVGLSFSALP